jgi:hypothetical protein
MAEYGIDAVEDDYYPDYDNIPSSICWGCTYCEDEPSSKVHCGHYGFSMIPIKKKCRYFKPQSTDHDPMEDFDPGCGICAHYNDPAFPCHQQGLQGCHFDIEHSCETCKKANECGNVDKIPPCDTWVNDEEAF